MSRKQAALYGSTHGLIQEIIDASSNDERKPTIADIVHTAVVILHERAMWEKNKGVSDE